jgi:DNA-binding transcriptional LysR family regulator
MNLRQLEVVEAVLRTGSLREAARMLGVSQPAVSKSLRLAEQAAGFVLFRRTRGRMFASTEAQQLLPEIERLRSNLAGIAALMRRLRDGGAGSVTVAAPSSLALPFVTPAVVRFGRARPGIRVETMILPTATVADRVVRSEADFGVVHQPTDSPYLDGDVVCEGEGVAVLPRRHALASRRTLTVQDLRAERLICYREDTAIGSLVRRALRAAGDHREIDLVINQSQQALDLVEAGAGVAIMDPFLLVAQPRAALAAVPFRPTFPNRVRIIRARERPRSRAAGELEREIRETILRRTERSPLSALVRPVRR